MKKLFGIVLICFLISSNAIADVINLLCYPIEINKEPATLSIDTKKQKVIWQGKGKGNTYNLNNGIFGYTLTSTKDNTHFRHTLNRYSGILTVEFFNFDEENLLKEFMINVKVKMDLAKKTTNDVLFFFTTYYEELGKFKSDYVMKFNCEKSEKKF